MDFIPFERDIAESIIADDGTSDEEMDHDNTALPYGNLVLLADIDTVPVSQRADPCYCFIFFAIYSSKIIAYLPLY
jgi:hypothetical protein